VQFPRRLIDPRRTAFGAFPEEGRRVLSNREKILDAAVLVAIRDGILAMTLDAVAQEAKVSKGGLIYHFRNKDDLITALLERFRAKVQTALEARMATDDNPQGRWFRALVATVFGPAQSGENARPGPTEMARFFMAMMAAFVNNPDLLNPVRCNMVAMRDRLLAEGPNGLRQVALWPAIYGLLLWRQLGVLSPEDPLSKSILDELLALAEGPDPSCSQE
jgi:AcrR family transcriptional regulator